MINMLLSSLDIATVHVNLHDHEYCNTEISYFNWSSYRNLHKNTFYSTQRIAYTILHTHSHQFSRIATRFTNNVDFSHSFVDRFIPVYIVKRLARIVSR